MIRRRQALGLIGTVLAGTALPLSAWGGTALAVPLEQLVKRSRVVLRGMPLEAYSVWEPVSGQRRIVTYSRVRFDEQFAGGPAESELMIRTLGGQVGEIGQVVHGEAVLRLKEACVLFVMRSKDGIDHVTAMAQGHYPIVRDDKGVMRLQMSQNLSYIVKADAGAVKRLSGRPVAEAKELIRGVMK